MLLTLSSSLGLSRLEQNLCQVTRDFIGQQLLQGSFIQNVSVSSSFPLFHYAFYAGSDQSTCSVVAGLPACA